MISTHGVRRKSRTRTRVYRLNDRAALVLLASKSKRELVNKVLDQQRNLQGES